MQFELEGTLVEKFETQRVSEKFQKREFVVEQRENRSGYDFQELIKFQLVQDKCDLINDFELGQNVSVSFNIRGRKWEKEGKVNYFTNLEAWRISSAANGPIPSAEPEANQTEDPDNILPF
jgi:single-strand DNA-binding protein